MGLSGASLRAEQPLAAEQFAIGTGGVVCEAQGVSLRGQRQSVFDRKWVLLCRDIGRPIGTALVIKGSGDGTAQLVAGRDEAIDCTATSERGPLGALRQSCTGRGSGLSYASYSLAKGGRTYRVEGLAAYDSALRLALQSLAENRQVPGEVAVVQTGAGDSAALNHARAAATDPDVLVGQGYRRNNAGAYAEAAELFEGVESAQQDRDDEAERDRRHHEVTVNRALQLSNLGEFDQSARLFEQARAMAARDPVQARLSRNFEAIDALNQGNLDATLDVLARPMPPLVSAPDPAGQAVAIDRSTAAGLNAGKLGELAGILGQEVRLTVPERVLIIDAQAQAIRGTVLRLQGRYAEARAEFGRAGETAVRIRDGRVVSIVRLRSQILAETALAHEAEGNVAAAEALLREALALVAAQYPDSASMNAARARLAGFLARHGQKSEARAVFAEIVQGVVGSRGALVGMANLMQPYFDMLAESAGGDAAAARDLFLASQMVERPGAADTLAQLSRQLEAGDDQAASLFRQSVAIGRDIERNRILIAQANAVAGGTANAAVLGDLDARQRRLLEAQAQVLTALSAYPQFRAVARNHVTADTLAQTLRPGEAYFKLTRLNQGVYASWITPGERKAWRVDLTASQLGDLVGTLRASISETVNGVRTTYPYDLDTALELTAHLFGPVKGELGGVRHIIFEPDGAMLQLPLGLLVTDAAGVEAYRARADQGGDEYDFRGVAWLARSRSISTALSAASFSDARKAPASRAARAFLGLGQNQPLGDRSGLPASTGSSDCAWPVATWNQPISGAELQAAAADLGPGSAEVVTGAAFTDSGLAARGDLAAFRILHFATHGLVTAPRNGCPARPALVTSFGAGNSDGLLRFDEIFNLHLDADLVVLSACDTAGQASLEATREAGLTTGGGQALDGLVRAFIAAGGRQVVASHWPAPDDYDATRRLFGGFYASKSASQGDAMAAAQRALMDDAATSHPFYWAGFALIGDGARAVPGR